MKFLFMPISILGGIAAGLVGKKIFEQIWGLVDGARALVVELLGQRPEAAATPSTP